MLISARLPRHPVEDVLVGRVSFSMVRTELPTRDRPVDMVVVDPGVPLWRDRSLDGDARQRIGRIRDPAGKLQ